MPDADPSWQRVAKVLLLRWPAGPGNKGWEREQVDGYVAELQVDGLTPQRALTGLRASRSAFIPSVGEVVALAHAAKGPPKAADILAAEQRHAERRRRSIGSGNA